MPMLEAAERRRHGGVRWLVEACARPGPGGARPLDDSLVADRLAVFETEVAGLRALSRRLVERHDTGTAGPADASIVKLYYSELLQRMIDYGSDASGLAAHTQPRKPAPSRWESGASG